MIFFIILYGWIILFGLYLWILVIASIPSINNTSAQINNLNYAIAITAHNEEKVIGSTIKSLQQMDYPSQFFEIFIVADFCSDNTAQEARASGAICFERSEGERNGKGGALVWLFERIFFAGQHYDAVVIFDADTRVDPQFINHINHRLNQGAQVVQGKHVISNPKAGWYPAFAWSLMTIDNRYNNHSRQNLNFSAKHMGDSICFRSQVLRQLGWGEGLTEDYEFRLRLLLEDIRIQYEPKATGYGQAPLTWKDAQIQRIRWLKGVSDARQRYSKRLLLAGLKNRSLAQIDGALSSMVPSYTTLTLISLLAFLLTLTWDSSQAQPFMILGAVILGLWFLYPFIGLALEKAPRWAYLFIFSGPFFMIWRTWLRLKILFSRQEIPWIRTTHHK